MTDDEVIAALRSEKTRLRAVQLAVVLGTLVDGGLSQSVLVTYFKRAFPSIPLRVLLEAGAWGRVSGGALSDDGFDNLLSPWLGEETDSD